MLAVATNHAGNEHCGVDTCDPSIAPGAGIFTLRVGFGAAF
ncbi:MAG: hypothetical protein ABUR63_08415 [Verrucomicrobiota bacterium]